MSDTSDFTQAKTAVREAFAGRLGRRHPDHPGGKNFMTPDILCYVRHGDVTVEVSTGWFDGQRFYGLTWPLVGGEPDERSTSADSLDEVTRLLEHEPKALDRCVHCGEEVQPVVGGDYDEPRPLATVSENDPACGSADAGLGHEVGR